ncbi:hypothetical protein LZ32DRAFT_600692 [Colletotrichum eremochloae]|nr:hypothetical protein LZ32DRAFT_600692 [Colletotrichum eremochloae]
MDGFCYALHCGATLAVSPDLSTLACPPHWCRQSEEGGGMGGMGFLSIVSRLDLLQVSISASRISGHVTPS